MAANREVLIENRARDQKDLGALIVDGEEHHLILGSSDDKMGAPVIKDQNGVILPGTPNQFSDDFPSPSQSVPLAVWRAYLNDRTRGPVIKAWGAGGEITVDGRGI